MLPEMLREREYCGMQADLFASVIVLFFLLKQRMPFAIADPERDMLYRILVSGHSDLFWHIHAQATEDGSIFTEEFKSMFQQMMV